MLDIAELLKGVNLNGLDKIPKPPLDFGGLPPAIEPSDHGHQPGARCPYCGTDLSPEAVKDAVAVFHEMRPYLLRLVEILAVLHPKGTPCLGEALRVYGEPQVRKVLGL